MSSHVGSSKRDAPGSEDGEKEGLQPSMVLPEPPEAVPAGRDTAKPRDMSAALAGVGLPRGRCAQHRGRAPGTGAGTAPRDPKYCHRQLWQKCSFLL